VAAGDASFQPTGDSVVGRVEPFGVAGGVDAVLPVAVLGFVEGVPDWNVLVVTSDHERCVVEEVVHDSGICPGAVRVEESEWGIWVCSASGPLRRRGIEIVTPVEQGHCWLDSECNHASNHIVVMGYSFLINWAVSKREESGPVSSQYSFTASGFWYSCHENEGEKYGTPKFARRAISCL
jgi:hypothetical protein